MDPGDPPVTQEDIDKMEKQEAEDMEDGKYCYWLLLEYLLFSCLFGLITTCSRGCDTTWTFGLFI